MNGGRGGEEGEVLSTLSRRYASPSPYFSLPLLAATPSAFLPLPSPGFSLPFDSPLRVTCGVVLSGQTASNNAPFFEERVGKREGGRKSQVYQGGGGGRDNGATAAAKEEAPHAPPLDLTECSGYLV